MKRTLMETKPASTNLVPTVFASMIIAALVTGSCVYTYEKNQNDITQANLQRQVDSLTLQIASKSSAIVTPIPSTGNWKLYAFDEAKISFKYPADWGTVTVLHGRTSQGTSPHIQFSANQTISAGTYSKDMSAGRGAEDHEFAIKSILSASNDCLKIKLKPVDKLFCTAIPTASTTTAYYVGNLGDHTPGPGSQELLTGYAQYPSTYNFPDFVFLSTDTNQQLVVAIKQLLSTVKFL